MTDTPSIRARRTKSAFTLVELLAAITIVAVLLALLFPALGAMRKRAGAAAGTQNLRQIYAAMQLYAADHNEEYPPGDLGVDGTGSGGPRGVIWATLIMPYLGEARRWSGPEWNAYCAQDAADGRYDNPPSKVLADPAADVAELDKIRATTRDAIWGYGYNVYPWRGLAASELPVPATNAWVLRNTPWGTWNPFVVQLIKRVNVSYRSTRCLVASAYDWHLIASAQRAYDRLGKNRAQVLFYDGHVATVNRQEFDLSIDDPKRLAQP